MGIRSRAVSRQSPQFLLLALVFVALLGGFLVWIWGTYPEWDDQQQAILEQQKYADRLVGSGVFSGGAFEEYVGFMSGHTQFSGDLDEYLQGTWYLLESYALALTSDLQRLTHAQELNQQARDLLESALLLAEEADYVAIQQNYQTAVKLGALISIKSCLFGLQDSFDTFGVTRSHLQTLQHTLAQEKELLKSYLLRESDPALFVCLQELLAQNIKTSATVFNYLSQVKDASGLAEELFVTRVEDPGVCLASETPQGLGKGFSLQVEQLLRKHQDLVVALLGDNPSAILQQCKPQDDSFGDDLRLEQQMQQMQEEIEEMSSSEEKDVFGTEDISREELETYEKELLEQVQEIGESWYQRVEDKQKNSNYDSLSEMQVIFGEFAGYSGDFVEKLEEREARSHGY